jgi:hypothetical protein
MSVDKMSVDKMLLNELPVDEMLVDEKSIGWRIDVSSFQDALSDDDSVVTGTPNSSMLAPDVTLTPVSDGRILDQSCDAVGEFFLKRFPSWEANLGSFWIGECWLK